MRRPGGWKRRLLALAVLALEIALAQGYFCAAIKMSAAAAGQMGRKEALRKGAASLGIAGAVGVGVGTERARNEPYYSLANERIYDTLRKSFLPAEPQRLIERRVGRHTPLICVGEVHTHPLHHRVQLEVIKAVHAMSEKNGEKFAIGLEMCYRQQQQALDSFISGSSSMEQLKADTRWTEIWGFRLDLYAKLFSYARLHGIPLVGLNVPRQVTTLVVRNGLDNLPRELRSLLPEIDLTVASHRSRFEETMNKMTGVHGPMSSQLLGRMYEAQCLWDEYMSDSAAKYLSRNPGISNLVLLAGAAHLEDRNGIPDRFERRTGSRPFTIVPQSVDWTEDGLPAVDHPGTEGYADWIYYTEKQIEARRI
jgi:uncharacterized iron-regulated protein